MNELELCCRLVRPLINDIESCTLSGRRGDALDPQDRIRHVELYGRIARSAFAPKAALETMNNELTNAITRCDLHHVARLAEGTLEMQGEASYWLLTRWMRTLSRALGSNSLRRTLSSRSGRDRRKIGTSRCVRFLT